MKIFDRGLVLRHRERAAENFSKHHFLFREIGDQLIDRLYDIKRRFPIVLDLGGHDGYLAQGVQGLAGVERVICCDLSAKMLKRAQGERIVADEEYLPFKSGYFSLVLSNLSLHWVNDLPGALVQIRQSLKPDGFFLASAFGGRTLSELREIFIQTELAHGKGVSPRISPFMEIRDAGMLLQRSGFALSMVNTEILTVQFETLYDLFSDLRGMGESNTLLSRTRGLSSRVLFEDVVQGYHDRFQTEEGKIFASFEILYLSGWAPDVSQPRALPRGSAKISLTDIF